MFSILHLVEMLKAEGLPSTRPTIWSWEKKGIIKKPKNFMHYGTRMHRLYSESEMRQIIFDIKKINSKKTQ